MNDSKLIQTSGPLFEAVQKSRMFSDSKYFVDCVPNKSPDAIMKAWESERGSEGFKLKSFVETHFDPPPVPGSVKMLAKEEPAAENCTEHIKKLWPQLFRSSDSAKSGLDSLIPLPHPYVVPGGRFREIYYWDSYFTALGLAAHGHKEMVLHMTRNFAHLIQTRRHVPNGNRTYYLSRSQPPFFTFMVSLCLELFGDELLDEFLPSVMKEHEFWMKPGRRCVELENGAKLNRYWDDNPAPREESWYEDYDLASPLSDDKKEQLYLNIRAACESGWDFSSRWFADEQNLRTIETTRILPVDLNALLWFMEMKLSEWLPAVSAGGNREGARYHALAEARRKAMNELMWNPETGFFHDYHIDKYQPTGVLSLAGVVPLFTGLANKHQSDETAKLLVSAFLKKGGLTTTLKETGQQWDAPNGWAPLQWMTVAGLRNYGHESVAVEIINRWIQANDIIFRQSAKMVEKYNVMDISGRAGGGEYPLQDGFGWSNGVYAAMSE